MQGSQLSWTDLQSEQSWICVSSKPRMNPAFADKIEKTSTLALLSNAVCMQTSPKSPFGFLHETILKLYCNNAVVECVKTNLKYVGLLCNNIITTPCNGALCDLSLPNKLWTHLPVIGGWATSWFSSSSSSSMVSLWDSWAFIVWSNCGDVLLGRGSFRKSSLCTGPDADSDPGVLCAFRDLKKSTNLGSDIIEQDESKVKKN